MRDDIVLTKLLRHDRAIVAVGAAVIALIGWGYLFYEGWAMQHMDLVAITMPSTGAWGLMDLLVVFAMWAVIEKTIPRGLCVARLAGPALMGFGGWIALSG
jgi:hypothetical protein